MLNAKIVLLAVVALLGSTTVAMADTYVRGYTRNDGAYVAPHYRSSPDSSYNNNWTVQPNVNPYTGQPGTRLPTPNDRAPAYGTSPVYPAQPGYGRRYPN